MSASFSTPELLAATGASLVGRDPETVAGVSTDSRSVGAGALFVALKGESFDGHAFVEAAARSGAAAALVARGAAVSAPEGFPRFEVEDTLVALGRLARHHRRRFALPLGAITGSNGKTTTKEMIGAILAQRGPALKTEGNLNNEVGVPLTLLRLSPEHSAAIVEMGMNHPGELTRLSSYAEPGCALITGVAPAHLEGLGTIDAVARAKGEIYTGLSHDGLALANGDDPRVLEQARLCGRPILVYGRAREAHVRLAAILEHGPAGLRIRIEWQGHRHECRLRFVGEHNALNACGAFAMGVALGCSAEQCLAGLEAARPWAHRLSLVDAPGGFTVIDDCYNANPSSMSAALSTLSALAGPRRKIAVLGDMLELGPEEERLHRELGEQAVASGVDLYVAFGPRSRAGHAAAAALGDRALHVADPKDPEPAIAFLKSRLRGGDLVLVKGSRGMRLERVVEALTGQGGGGH